jgi:bifunctional non-homologous end joining protein LigD
MAAVRPMLATLVEAGDVPLASDRLVYEPKYDGIRAVVAIEPSAQPGRRQEAPAPTADRRTPRVTIRSRKGHDKTPQFPDLVQALASFASKRQAPLLLDGEIVALDERDRPASFTRLQKRIHPTGAKAIAGLVRAQPVAFVAFDLLRDGDEDLRRLPFTARRLRLQTTFAAAAQGSPRLRLSEVAVANGRTLHARAEQEGWEGLIVKDGGSVYESGRRSPAWRKLKLHKRQEFVVGGWTEGRQSRAHFGALLLGTWNEPGAGHPRTLRFAGSVGTGFDERELARVAGLLRTRETKSSPFAETVKTLELAHWVRPDLVVEVRYAEWTPDGRLRHPVYLGVRDDKESRDVVTERPADAHKTPKASARIKHRRRAARLKIETRESARAAVVDRLRVLEDARKDGWIDLPDGHRLRVTNLWKVFWPELRLTKGDLLRYYADVSPLILPAVTDRPLVMKRFPNGIHGKAFYQQRVLDAPPAGVRIETLPEGMDPIREDEEVRNPQRFVGGSLTTLLYMAQMAAISQDPWFSTVRAPLDADQVAIDLDPGVGATWQTVLDVARWVRDALQRLRVPGVPKTSGSRGLHIYVPLPPRTSYETGLLLCQIVATLVASEHPGQATVERTVARRPKGTVYVDYLQNILGKTLATAYSARASDFAGVSTPLAWKEVDEGIDARDLTLRTAPARFREVGDLWGRLRAGKPADLRALLDRAVRDRRRRGAS